MDSCLVPTRRSCSRWFTSSFLEGIQIDGVNILPNPIWQLIDGACHEEELDAHLDTTNPTKPKLALEMNTSSQQTSQHSTSHAIGLKAPTSHASTATTYGVSSSTNYGHAMASSTTPYCRKYGRGWFGRYQVRPRKPCPLPLTHQGRSLDVATITDDGLMSSEDKVILDGSVIRNITTIPTTKRKLQLD